MMSEAAKELWGYIYLRVGLLVAIKFFCVCVCAAKQVFNLFLFFSKFPNYKAA